MLKSFIINRFATKSREFNRDSRFYFFANFQTIVNAQMVSIELAVRYASLPIE